MYKTYHVYGDTAERFSADLFRLTEKINRSLHSYISSITHAVSGNGIFSAIVVVQELEGR